MATSYHSNEVTSSCVPGVESGSADAEPSKITEAASQRTAVTAPGVHNGSFSPMLSAWKAPAQAADFQHAGSDAPFSVYVRLGGLSPRPLWMSVVLDDAERIRVPLSLLRVERSEHPFPAG